MKDEDDFALPPDLVLSGRTAQQLIKRLEIGDCSSLAEDARDLMKIYHDQVAAGQRVSRSLELWIAEVFREFISGEAPSLDAAFNQKPRGRPLLMTPSAKRKIVAAYAAAKKKALEEHRSDREAEIAGEHAAYFALHGRAAEAPHVPGGEGALADALDRIRKVIKDFFRKK